MLRFILGLLFTILIALFGASNLHLVELNTVFGDDVKASLAFLLLGTFTMGFMLATLFALHRTFVTRRRHRIQYTELVEASPVALPIPPHIPQPVAIPEKRRFWQFGR